MVVGQRSRRGNAAAGAPLGAEPVAQSLGPVLEGGLSPEPTPFPLFTVLGKSLTLRVATEHADSNFRIARSSDGLISKESSA